MLYSSYQLKAVCAHLVSVVVSNKEGGNRWEGWGETKRVKFTDHQRAVWTHYPILGKKMNCLMSFSINPTVKIGPKYT